MVSTLAQGSASQTSQDDQRIVRLTDMLTSAIRGRGQHYVNFFSFAVRFEKDNTQASIDTEHFQAILELLTMPKAEEIIISGDDHEPGWTVQGRLRDIVRRINLNKGRTLLMGNYAGHGTTSVNGELMFFASPSYPRRMSFERTFQLLWAEEEEYLNETDVVLILDSCYSGLATRGSETAQRSVEIIASVDAEHQALGNIPSGRVRIQNNTFMSRLANDITHRVSYLCARSLSMSNIIGELRARCSVNRLPQYHLRLGHVGIRIPVLVPAEPTQAQGPSWRRRQAASSSSEEFQVTSSSTLPSSQSGLNAVFRLHLGNTDPTGEDATRLVSWVRSLPVQLGIEVVGVYRSHSTVVIFHTPWHIWAQLNGLSAYSLVCETIGRNLLTSQRPSTPQPQGSMSSPLRLSTTANLPLRENPRPGSKQGPENTRSGGGTVE